MNVDLEVLKKELEYISLCIRTCVNIDLYHNLIKSFDYLNSLYKNFTGKDYKKPNSLFIGEDVYIEYLLDNATKINTSIVKRYDREKLFTAPLMLNYMEKFVNKKNDLPNNSEPYIYSLEEAKELILDFFSKYDKRIYDIVLNVFNNNQIQTNASNKYFLSDNEMEINFYLDVYGDLQTENYTDKSMKKFMKIYYFVLDEVNSDKKISDKKFEEYVNTLKKYYNKLVPIDPNFKKPTIEYDGGDDYLAQVATIHSLKKSYVMIFGDSFDMETISCIVHELGHVIENELSVFQENINVYDDTNYLAEVISSFFEYEFNKYVLEKNSNDVDAQENLIYFYSDILDRFENLFDALKYETFIGLQSDQALYKNEKSGEVISIDISSKVRYSLAGFLAIVFSNKGFQSDEQLYDFIKEFALKREILGTEELLYHLGITNEDLLDLSFLDEEANKLTKKFNN